jgi:hypothetical protein
MCYIELDKLSLLEIKGHLADHMKIDSEVQLHWLYPGKELGEGLRLLYDDSSCLVIPQHITEGGVADIYVEVMVAAQEAKDTEDTDWELDKSEADDELEEMYVVRTPKKKQDRDLMTFRDFYRSPSKSSKDVYAQKGKSPIVEDVSSSDAEFQPKDLNSSRDDEEAEQLRQFAKQIKMDIRAKKLGENKKLAMIIAGGFEDEQENLEDDDSPYLNSSDDYSYEEDSDGESFKWKSTENRYDSKAHVPVFALGMAFRSSRQFKKALVKYGLTTHRHLLFPKDEKNKVKAVCSWKGCNWLIYGSKTTRSDWFKVVTFVDDHCCPPRRDNKLVTSRRIASKYKDQIRDNPTWKVDLIRQAVLNDFLCDVSLAKCKRAKALVLQEALDSTKGEYSKVYDYQMELLRSNPGSTIVVMLNPEIVLKKVFQRFYVCFDACKKGFLIGCRRVVGLDGCFFKVATNGELLCAIGRDAKNQMYPIAWAYVERETYDSWYWFLGLLQKDLNISNEGEGWVLISDQQKVYTSIHLLILMCEVPVH